MNVFCNKKITYQIFSIIMFALVVNTSCSSDDSDPTILSSLHLSTDKSLVDYQENTIILSVESDNDETWQVTIAEEYQSWISADKNSGTKNGTVKLSIKENTETKDRFGKITISTTSEEKNVYITQTGSKGAPFDINNANWIELPAKSSISNTILVGHLLPNSSSIRNYSMLYDTINKLAYWVAYPMHSYYRGSADRTDNWQYDPFIKKSYQPELFSGFGIANTDRGHQIPSADRTISKEANESTFYFSNMTAQNSTLNQRMWADLENKVRVWMNQCDTLYVVTGAMIKTATDSSIDYVKDNSGATVARPKYYYKALAKRMGNTYYTIAYKMNNEVPTLASYDNYRITVAQLEKETGFTFFPKITTEDKSKVVSEQWK